MTLLHQGWLLTPANLESFISTVVSGLHRLEEQVSRIAACVIDELETIRLQSERMMGALFEESVAAAGTNPMGRRLKRLPKLTQSYLIIASGT